MDSELFDDLRDKLQELYATLCYPEPNDPDWVRECGEYLEVINKLWTDAVINPHFDHG